MAKVLQVLPTFHTGGVEQTTLLVANALAERGEKSFIISAGGDLLKNLHPSVTHICLPVNTKNPFKIFSNVKKIKKIIENNNINIVHARSRAPAWSAYFAAKATDAHFVTTYHGAYSQNFLKWYYNRVMAAGKPVVVASRYMQMHVQYYYSNVKCVQIPSGINTKFFSPELANPHHVQELKLAWGAQGDTKIILLVGRFTHIKGHHVLLQAISKSIYKNKIKVIFVGDSKNPHLVNKLKKQADEHCLSLYIHQDEKDLRPFFSAADVVVVPSIKPEAFGRVTVEAMSMGKVVIVNDLGASCEVVNNPEWVFDHSNVESLVQKIDQALNLNTEQAYEIGNLNRMRACSLYDVEGLIEGHLGLYESLVKAE